MIEFKGSHFEHDVILWGVRWYVAYPISYRQLEEMMEERGVEVDHSTLNRWVVKYAPELDRQFRSRKRPVGSSRRLDETYVKIKGSWKSRASARADDAVVASPATENEAERPSCGPHTTVQLADPNRFIGTNLLKKRFAFGDLAFRQGSGGASGLSFGLNN